MRIPKTAIILGIELIILWLISEWIAKKWVLPEIEYRGEEEFWAQVFFVIVFIFNATLYLILHLLKAIKRKGFSTIYKEKTYLLSFVAGVILLALSGYSINGMLLYRPSLWILILPPIALFLLHLGIAKLIAKKRSGTV